MSPGPGRFPAPHHIEGANQSVRGPHHRVGDGTDQQRRCSDRSILQFLAEIVAEELLFQDDPIAIVDGYLARLIGIRQPVCFRYRLFSVAKAGTRLAFSFSSSAAGCCDKSVGTGVSAALLSVCDC